MKVINSLGVVLLLVGTSEAIKLGNKYVIEDDLFEDSDMALT